METKTCKGCGIDKPITDFGRDSSKKTGLKGKCKQCRAADKRALHVHHGRERQLQYRHENRDKRLAQKAVDRAVQSGRLPRVGEIRVLSVRFKHRSITIGAMNRLTSLV